MPANWQRPKPWKQWVCLLAWCFHSVDAKSFSQAVSFPCSPTTFHTVSIVKLKLCTQPHTSFVALPTLQSSAGLGILWDSTPDLLEVISIKKNPDINKAHTLLLGGPAPTSSLSGTNGLAGFCPGSPKLGTNSLAAWVTAPHGTGRCSI